MSSKLEVGSIVEGKVVKIKPFGAIVSLPGNAQGLVHISHISNSFVQNISDHLSVGDQVKVKILSVDAATGKISLSIKEAEHQVRHDSRNEDVKQEIRQKPPVESLGSFEDKFKEWVKVSNERQAGINKRNKRR